MQNRPEAVDFVLRSLGIIVVGLGIGSVLGCAVIASHVPASLSTASTSYLYEPALHPALVATGQLLATLAAFLACESSPPDRAT